jgi:4a-hydroxytetrahydrobiopterin dehydratase
MQAGQFSFLDDSSSLAAASIGVETKTRRKGAVMELGNKKCVPCEGGATTLPAGEVNRLLSQLSGWQVESGAPELRKRYKFASFMDTMAFVNRMAELAETEGHHPDFCVRYTILDVSLTTHAIGGLSENDFILAAKIDQI